MIFKLSSFLALAFALFSLHVVTGLQIPGRDVKQLNRRDSNADSVPYQYFTDSVNGTLGSCGELINVNPDPRSPAVYTISLDEKFFVAGDANDTRTICKCGGLIALSADTANGTISQSFKGQVVDKCTDCGGGLRLPQTIFNNTQGFGAVSGGFECSNRNLL